MVVILFQFRLQPWRPILKNVLIFEKKGGC
jgi:hypothetical protein